MERSQRLVPEERVALTPAAEKQRMARHQTRPSRLHSVEHLLFAPRITGWFQRLGRPKCYSLWIYVPEVLIIRRKQQEVM